MPLRNETERTFSDDAEIFADGVRLCSARECEIKTVRESRLLCSCGEGTANAVAVGAKQYVITLSEIERRDSTDFEGLSDFSVRIKKQGRLYSYSHCEWVQLSENTVNGRATVKKAVIVSPRLQITEVGDEQRQ